MPEGPEIKTSSLFVNHVCRNVTFTGNPQKSSVSKNPEVAFSSQKYTISSESRGKEIALLLVCTENSKYKTRILFRFGMSGRFRFTLADDLLKHSHLVFYSASSPKMALSYVDPRRFGSWHETDEWGPNRGPDPVLEYRLFCDNICDNLHIGLFNKPICEVMLNQQYFNGIGNYLRAEILYRARVPPFLAARVALKQTTVNSNVQEKNDKLCEEDCSILQLCCDVQIEVLNLKKGLGKTEDCSVTDDDYTAFMDWLQCYENPSMNNLVDHNKRTIWFNGSPGPLTPKVKKSRGRKRKITETNSNDLQDTINNCDDDISNDPKQTSKTETKDIDSIKVEPDTSSCTWSTNSNNKRTRLNKTRELKKGKILQDPDHRDGIKQECRGVLTRSQKRMLKK